MNQRELMNQKALLFITSISLVFTTTCTNLPQSSPNATTVALTLVPEQLNTEELENIAKLITVKVHVGEDRGSGFLIAKNNHTYQVVTNAHVVNRADNYSIETFDGIKHQTTLIYQDSSETKNDLAILEFTSTNSYQVAEIADSKKLSTGDRVLAAGFPFDASNIKLSLGTISLLTAKPIKGGYQIGFSNETLQGMSGGVLLNNQGKVIGVLGKGKGAIFDTAYHYQDGTIPAPATITTMKDASFSIPIAQVAAIAPELAAIFPRQYQ